MLAPPVIFFDCLSFADSIEYCGDGSFLCGTYRLREDAERNVRWREGAVLRFQTVDAQTVPTMKQNFLCRAGVLDMKLRRTQNAVLCVVQSEGVVQLLKRENESSDFEEAFCGVANVETKALEHCENAANCALINLSCDWSCSGDRFVVSHSDGSLSLWNANDSTNALWGLNCHENEAWIAACSRSDEHVVWSGSDDAVLRGWDTRVGFAAKRQTFEWRGDAGVTSIACSPHNTDIWAVGSYDERVRMFDARNPRKPFLESPRRDGPFGGGIWRIKWHPTNDSWIALASMRGGFQVAKSSDLSVLHQNSAHPSEALAYGIDWIPDRNIVACCSFYDSRGSIFKFPREE